MTETPALQRREHPGFNGRVWPGTAALMVRRNR